MMTSHLTDAEEKLSLMSLYPSDLTSRLNPKLVQLENILESIDVDLREIKSEMYDYIKNTKKEELYRDYANTHSTDDTIKAVNINYIRQLMLNKHIYKGYHECSDRGEYNEYFEEDDEKPDGIWISKPCTAAWCGAFVYFIPSNIHSMKILYNQNCAEIGLIGIDWLNLHCAMRQPAEADDAPEYKNLREHFRDKLENFNHS